MTGSILDTSILINNCVSTLYSILLSQTLERGRNRRNMNTIDYRNPRFYQARHMPQPLPKACTQAANEPRARESNEQSPPAVTPVTPDSENPLNPSSKASSIEVFRQCLEDGLTSAEDIAREMGVSKGTVSKWAKRAMKEGRLKKHGREYGLV
jgi:DNA-binding transcriptional regulator YiaG